MKFRNELLIRDTKKHHWIKITIGRFENTPFHGWQYGGLVRRDSYTLFRFGVIVTKLPHKELMKNVH